MIDRSSPRMISVWSQPNEFEWLRTPWLVTMFLLLCGSAVPAIIPFVGLDVSAGRMALCVFLFLLATAVLVHQGRIGPRIAVGRYVLFLGLWFLWAVGSLFWASDTTRWFGQTQGIAVGSIVAFVSLVFLSNRRGISMFHTLWVIAGAIFIGIAVWEMATGMHLNSSREAEWIGLRETLPTAVFVNPNDFATFLCLALPFMFGLVMLRRRGRERVAVSILVLASIYFIVLTSSRANIIACSIGLGLILFMPGVSRRVQSIAVVVAVGLMVVLVGYTFLLSSFASDIDMFKTLPEQVRSLGAGDPSTVTRVNLIRNGWAFLQQSHYLGVGAGSFEYWMAERSIYHTGGIVNPHNWWLEVVVDYGLPMFALFMVFYLGLVWNMFRIFRGSDDGVVKVVAFASFIALVEFAIASSSSSGLMGACYVWLLFATALCVINCHRTGRPGAQEQKRLLGNDKACETRIGVAEEERARRLCQQPVS